VAKEVLLRSHTNTNRTGTLKLKVAGLSEFEFTFSVLCKVPASITSFSGSMLRARSRSGRDPPPLPTGLTEAGDNTESATASPSASPSLRRTPSTRPFTLRKSTLTIREAVLQRINDTTVPSAVAKPSAKTVEDFKLLVHKLDASRGKPSVSDPLMAELEECALQLFGYFDSKEKAHRHLSMSEFQLKSMVDDVLVQLLNINVPKPTPLTPNAPTTTPSTTPPISPGAPAPAPQAAMPDLPRGSQRRSRRVQTPPPLPILDAES